MTKPRTYQYRIQYVDNTYQIIDWTKGEFKKVQDQLASERSVIVMPNEVIKACDIRAIVLLPEEVEKTAEEIKNEQENLTEWGFVDAQTREWLAANGIDLSKGVNQ